ncbi:RNA polymerase sigma factor [Hephaestia mangrovi]|uniref:RNA polymerase sigma factor n=1 Tax=Hephaestia mangrovi TaxID=2873268 RepID=UPI001CA6F235|nr:RNA polymerase sigma factor [Hephaestia mangrovi]
MTTALDQFDDRRLAVLARDGDEAAFAEIMRRHRAAIYRLVAICSGDVEEALDLTQDSFVAAYRNLARYDSARPLRPWLSAIALNRCRDWRRRRRVRALLAWGDAVATTVPDDRPDPETVAGDRAALDALRREIAQLPAKLRDVLMLRTIEGLSQAETAEALGITVKAVETRLSRARARLAEKFAAE